MQPLIDQLDSVLRELRPDYYGRLQAGVPQSRIEEVQSQLHRELPSAFRDLYSWRNGQSSSCSDSLVDNWMFTPLDDLLESKAILDGMIGSDFEETGWWSRGWLPFLSNGGGDHLCLDLDAEFGGSPGQVLTFWHDWENRSTRFTSLEAWLANTVVNLKGRSPVNGDGRPI